MTARDIPQAFRAAILTDLGHAPERIEPGRLQRFATNDRRGDTAGWCRLFDDLRAGAYGCMRSGIKKAWSAQDRDTLTATERADLAHQARVATQRRQDLQRLQWAENAQRIAYVWAQCVPLVPGDPVSRYLHNRGLDDARLLPDLLRLHPSLAYWHHGEKLGTFAAMVAPLMSPDGSMVALHRTYLGADGCKADVPSPKKLTGAAGMLTGACIPLFAPVHGCLGIAEGIETALAASYASSVPTVAAYCAGNLAAWRWPDGIQRLLIFGDAAYFSPS